MLAPLRSIPSMDKCLRHLQTTHGDLANVPRVLLKELINLFFEQVRATLKLEQSAPRGEMLLADMAAFVKDSLKPGLKVVLNGTGVVIHTNLGRSILAEKACEAVSLVARNYCNLEMDLATGERGSRHELVNDLVRFTTGAEDAMVVNNNAAAVLLTLDTFCHGGETIVSRGELVEIGGSFRIPDIMEKSGATLKEVGTTNRTHLEDYRKAISPETRAIMRVHTSNYRIVGFHAAADLKELKNLAREHNLPLLVDLGSGSLLEIPGLPPEPTVRSVLEAGADLVTFSGDKVLGGPQAGIVAGRKDLVEKMKKNPLTRALRCDKLCLSALAATLRLHLDPDQARKDVPTLAMIEKTPETLEREARALARTMRNAFMANNIACRVELGEGSSRVGGGSFPECSLPTTLVCLQPGHITAHQLRIRLLKGEVPLIGRMEKDRFCLDPRTLPKRDYGLAASAVVAALSVG